MDKTDENIFEINNSAKKIILNNILKTDKHTDKIFISNDVYNDTSIDKWASKLPTLEGGKILIDKIIKNPTNNIKLLIDRQQSFIDIDLTKLKEHENDVLWTYLLNNEIKEESSINMLYISTYIASYINKIDVLLDFYHLYKIFFIPLMALFYPLSTIYAPYYYINKYMKFNVKFTDYLKMIFNVFKTFLKFTGNFKMDLLKLIIVIIYIGVYIFNIYQTFEIAYYMYKIKCKLHNKMKGLISFINEAVSIINSVPEKMWKSFYLYDDISIDDITDFKLNNSLSDIYILWKNDKYKEKISKILKIIYTIDIVNSISKLKNTKEWSIPKYVDTKTKLWGMKNPILNNEQQSNPIDLDKNIIVTGPNAAGKTTYVKSITANIVLAQTLGITYSLKSEILIYDTIISFMRIVDILGSKSYFEVETEYCSNMIKNAIELTKNNKKGLFIMDEPMHSTPPIEGMSTAYAVAEFLGNLNGIKLIITTHFHKLIELENNYPDRFINLSVEAIKNNDILQPYKFPYKINKGFSKQCIAIELLGKQKFPVDVIKSAIEMKNKLCSEIYSSNN
jgi:hypothetical protein